MHINYFMVNCIMKQYTIVALLGIVLAVTIGMAGFSGAFVMPSLSTQSTPNLKMGFGLLGHVTYVVKDKDGNIKQYLQTDNVVTQAGRNCAAQELFQNLTSAPGVGSAACKVAAGGLTTATNGFNWIGIGNGTNAVSATGTDQNLTLNQLGSTKYGEVTPRQQGTVVFTAATGGPNLGPQATITSPAFAFTHLTSTTVLNQAGLFDRTGSAALGGIAGNVAAPAGNMFADQNINVSVAPSDTLTVTWKITLG
jgi:hypothetical protein